MNTEQKLIRAKKLLERETKGTPAYAKAKENLDALQDVFDVENPSKKGK